jgi:hypothetical protein
VGRCLGSLRGDKARGDKTCLRIMVTGEFERLEDENMNR